MPGILLKKAKMASRWGKVYYTFAFVNLGAMIGCMVNRMIEPGLIVTVISIVSFTAGFMFSEEGKYLKTLVKGLEKYISLLEEKDELYNEILMKIESVKTENKKEENKNGTI